jgi:hypothetical protein
MPVLKRAARADGTLRLWLYDDTTRLPAHLVRHAMLVLQQLVPAYILTTLCTCTILFLGRGWLAHQ